MGGVALLGDGIFVGAAQPNAERASFAALAITPKIKAKAAGVLIPRSP